MPDGFISVWCGGPCAAPCSASSVAATAVAVCTEVLKVAAIATPCPFSVTVTGFVRPKLWHDRLVKDMLSRLAMKVNRLSPTDVTGDEPVASSVWLAARNGVWMSIMSWQNISGLLVRLFAAETGAWPISSR